MEQQTADSRQPKKRGGVSFFKKYNQIEAHAAAVRLSAELAPLVARFRIKKIPQGVSGLEEGGDMNEHQKAGAKAASRAKEAAKLKKRSRQRKEAKATWTAKQKRGRSRKDGKDDKSAVRAFN